MKGVWQTRLNAQSVPPLPDNVPINEPQLAAMLFDKICQVLHFKSISLEQSLKFSVIQACGASAINKVYHDQLLVRLCKGCLSYK